MLSSVQNTSGLRGWNKFGFLWTDFIITWHLMGYWAPSPALAKVPPHIDNSASPKIF